MARNSYTTRAFFRQMPNALLARYFESRGVLGDLDFTALKETRPEELFAAWLSLEVGGIVSAVRASQPTRNELVRDIARDTLASPVIEDAEIILVKGLSPGLGLQLERNGFDVRFPDSVESRVGGHRALNGVTPDVTLVVHRDRAIFAALSDPRHELVALADSLPVGERSRLERLAREDLDISPDYDKVTLWKSLVGRFRETDDPSRIQELAAMAASLGQLRLAVFKVR